MERFVEPGYAYESLVTPLREAVCLGLRGEPARTGGVDHPSAGDLVKGAQDLCRQARMPEGIVHAVAAKLHPPGQRAQRRHGGPEFQDRLAAVQMRVLHMVRNPDRIEPQILGHPRHFQRVVVGGRGRAHFTLDVEPQAEFYPGHSIFSFPFQVRDDRTRRECHPPPSRYAHRCRRSGAPESLT